MGHLEGGWLASVATGAPRLDGTDAMNACLRASYSPAFRGKVLGRDFQNRILRRSLTEVVPTLCLKCVHARR